MVDQRSEFLSEWRWSGLTKAALCRVFGISRQTGYKWARRAKLERSIAEHSRRPKRSPNRTPGKLVRLILSKRKQYPRWGPIALRELLKRDWPQTKWPATSTIGDILKRHGMVKPRRFRKRVPPRTNPFSSCREPNDVWCVDFKGQFAMGNGHTCYPLTVMDAASRFLLACTGFHEPSFANVKRVFDELFLRYGLPKAIRSDNGEPFASAGAVGGLTQLAAWWVRLGIRLERIDPGKPQQNGRHERMHLTLKQATCLPPRRSMGWQQRAFDRFRAEYNEIRPHQSLGLKTPASLYKASARALPEQLPTLQYPFADIHRVRSDGTIRIGLRNQFISSTLVGEMVGVYAISDRFCEVRYADLLLGCIDFRNGNGNPRKNLVRPRPPHGGKRSTKLSAMSPV